MTINIDIPAELEAQLREEAALSGNSLDKLVLKTLLEKYTSTAENKPATFEEWDSLLQETIDLHPQVARELDVSRDSIY